MALFEVNFFSDVLGMNVAMNVVIPQRARGVIGVDYDESKFDKDKFSTLYLLHGLSDDHTTWARRTAVELFAEQHCMAVVMPSTHRAWYTNEAHGMKYRTFIGEELPRVCRSFFRGMSDKREDNYIAGISMGGYGALSLALTYPEQYSVCIPFSASFDTKWLINDDKAYFEDVFGPVENYDGSENDVFALAERTKKEGKPTPKIYMWCGRDDFLIEGNRRMAKLLGDLNYDVTYSETEGTHGWVWWNKHIDEMFNFIYEYQKSISG